MQHMNLEDFVKDDYDVRVHEIRLTFHGPVNSVHRSLGGGRGIVEPQWQSFKLKEAMVASERSLLTVSGLVPNY